MATFSYDVALEPTYIDFADIGSGYGILSAPIDGFLPEDSIGTVTLVIAPTSGSGAIISKAIDMVQRTDGYFEYTAQDAISAHFSLTPADLVTINAGTYGYSISAIVTRNGVVRSREVQAGNIAARPTSVTPPLIVSTIVITGGPVTGDIGDTAALSAAAFDAYDNEIAGQLITWSSSNPLVAQVDQSGLVTFLLPGTATITASAQGVTDTTTATAQDPAFISPSTNQVPVYNGSEWAPAFVTPEMLKPGTFGDNVAHDPYIFPRAVQAQSFAGDGSGLTNLNMAAAATGTLAVARGGTGLGTMGSIGAILYATAALSLAALAGNTSATKKFLSQTGDGSASAAPAWAQLATADISDLTSAATGITKLGTVNTGTWQATAIADTYLATISTAGKVANSATTATSANTASAIVSRDSSGDFTARNITATLFAGSGASLTNLNASQLTSGSIAATVGGTGQTAVVTGDLLYGSAANTWSRLTGNTSTAREFLLSAGTGSAAQAPSWSTLVAGDIPNLAASSITSGTLDEAVGGTGHSSYAIGDLLYASATDSLARLSGNVSTTKRFLTQSGNATTANAPQWWTLVADDVGAGTFTGAFTFANGLSFGYTISSTLGTITASTPMLSSTATWNNSLIAFVHELVNITDTSSDAASLLTDWRVGGVSKWSVDKTGAVKTGIWNGTAIANAYLATGIDVAKLTVGTTLPPNVVTSSLTGLGTIVTGVWHGTSIATTYTDAKIKTVTGTASRLSIGGTSTDPTFDIDAAYVGQTSLTTLGTVTTGTWSATTIATTKGGTGLTSYTLGDLLYSSASNTLAKLAGNTAVQSKFLMQTGDGAASAAPAWHTLVVSDLTDITTAATGITKVGTINTGVWQGTIVDPTYGGTGVNNGARTLTLAGNLVTSGASSITLTSTGATNVTLPTTGTLVNTAGNVATATALQNTRTIWGQNFDGTANVSGALTGVTTINSQTISATAAFTGTMSVAGVLTATVGVAVSGGASGQGKLWFSSTDGLVVQAKTGSSFDFALYSPGAGYIAVVPTGTANIRFNGDVQAITDGGGDIGSGGKRFRHLTLSGDIAGAGTAAITGLITASAGITIAGGSAGANKIVSDAVTGLQISGRTGSAYDLYFTGPGGAAILNVPTGTVNVGLAGNLAITGTLSGVTALGVSGLLTSSVGNTGTVILSNGASTGYIVVADVQTTGGRFLLGIERSTGGGNILSGSSAYSTCFGTVGSTSLCFGTAGATRLTLSATGDSTFTGAVATGGALTISGNLVAAANETYDIGGANQFRDLYLSRNLIMSGGSLSIAGPITGVGTTGGVSRMTSTSNGSVANGGTLDLSTNTSGGTYAGILVVVSNDISNAGNSTRTVYAVTGRGTSATFAVVSSTNGATASWAFTMSVPSNGVLRATNAGGNTANMEMSWFGLDGG